ncbi:MAG TPA: hypothetical protein GX699_09080 [Firmicutes bacterium]|nr:hypothetical protein [Bacillota bacterium]
MIVHRTAAKTVGHLVAMREGKRLLKKYWKAAVLFCLVAVTAFFAAHRLFRQTAGGEDANQIDILATVVEQTGARIVEGEMQYFAVLDNSFQPMEKLEQFLLEVAEALHITSGTVEKGAGDTYRVIDLTGRSQAGLHTHIVVQSNPGDRQAAIPPQTYLLVVVSDASPAVLKAAAGDFAGRLKPFAENGQFSCYLTGYLAGKKSDREMAYLAQSALQAVEAEPVEEFTVEELVSYTAYTPRLSAAVREGGAPFNVNIAVRYDNFLEKTVVWAGFPLIHDPY